MPICDLLTCGVCGERKAYAIITSSLLSVTYPTCVQCYNKNAEPKWIFDYLVEHECDRKHDYITMFYTVVDGNYISWKEYYEENKEKTQSNSESA